MDHDIYSSSEDLEDITNDFLRALDKRPRLYLDAEHTQTPNIHYVIKMGSPSRLEEGMRAVKAMANNSKVVVGLICVHDNRAEDSHKVSQPLVEDSNVMCIQLHCYDSEDRMKLHNCKCNMRILQSLTSFLQGFGVQLSIQTMFPRSPVPTSTSLSGKDNAIHTVSADNTTEEKYDFDAKYREDLKKREQREKPKGDLTFGAHELPTTKQISAPQTPRPLPIPQSMHATYQSAEQNAVPGTIYTDIPDKLVAVGGEIRDIVSSINKPTNVKRIISISPATKPPKGADMFLTVKELTTNEFRHFSQNIASRVNDAKVVLAIACINDGHACNLPSQHESVLCVPVHCRKISGSLELDNCPCNEATFKNIKTQLDIIDEIKNIAKTEAQKSSKCVIV